MAELSLDALRLLQVLWLDDNFPRQRLRDVAVLSTLDAGFGAAGKDQDGDLLVSCASCATAEELANAREVAGQLEILCRGMSSSN